MKQPLKTDFIIEYGQTCPGWDYLDVEDIREHRLYDKRAYNKAMARYQEDNKTNSKSAIDVEESEKLKVIAFAHFRIGVGDNPDRKVLSEPLEKILEERRYYAKTILEGTLNEKEAFKMLEYCNTQIKKVLGL